MSNSMDSLVQSLRAKDYLGVALHAREANLRESSQHRQYDILNIAAQVGDLDSMKILLDSGLGIDSVGQHGLTNLMACATRDNPSIIHFLLENGANPNFYHIRQGTALHLAAQRNQTAIAKLLIEYGAKDDKTDYAGFTAYNWACRQAGDILTDYLDDLRAKSLI